MKLYHVVYGTVHDIVHDTVHGIHSTEHDTVHGIGALRKALRKLPAAPTHENSKIVASSDQVIGLPQTRASLSWSCILALQPPEGEIEILWPIHPQALAGCHIGDELTLHRVLIYGRQQSLGAKSNRLCRGFLMPLCLQEPRGFAGSQNCPLISSSLLEGVGHADPLLPDEGLPDGRASSSTSMLHMAMGLAMTEGTGADGKLSLPFSKAASCLILLLAERLDSA